MFLFINSSPIFWGKKNMPENMSEETCTKQTYFLAEAPKKTHALLEMGY